MMNFLHPIRSIKETADKFVDDSLAKTKKEISVAKPAVIAAIVYLAILEIAVIAIAVALLKIAFF